MMRGGRGVDGFAAAMVAAFVAAAVAASSASAQSIAKPNADAASPEQAKEAQAKKAAAAQSALNAGVKAFDGGKLEPAIQSLSTAISTGGLSSQQMAKALYTRGVAYRKQGKPAQAISDLTSAIWLKNGLGEKEKSDAEENRAAAYREAGVAQSGGKEEKLPWGGTAQTQGSPGAGQMTPGSWQTAGTPEAAAKQESPKGDSGGGVGGFFGSIFGSSSGSSGSTTEPAPPPAAPSGPPAASQSPPAPQTAPWQAADGRPPPPSQAADVPPRSAPETALAAPAASNWATTTTAGENEKVAAATDLPWKAAPPGKGVAAPAKAVAGEGKYKLQVGTVRTREEADALAARLRAEHAKSIGAATLAVDEAVVGNMGTFFRVQVGPYRTAEETGPICRKLKASGFDCLVVSQ